MTRIQYTTKLLVPVCALIYLSFCVNKSLNIRLQLYIGAKRLMFGVGLPILPYYVYKSSDGSIETAYCAVSTEPLLITYGHRRDKTCLRRIALFGKYYI